MTERCYVAIDTETTGFNGVPGTVITQIAAVAIGEDSKQFLSAGALRVRLTPEEIQCFSKEAMDIQGWTPEINATGITVTECLQQFRAWLQQLNPCAYVAHRASFDASFCNRQGFTDPNVPWCCTCQGFKLLQDRGGGSFKNHKLASLAEACGYKPTAAHQAYEDVLACANGFLWLQSRGIRPSDMIINFAMKG
jgi:DNA polymerase III epsilon subunit-like protein